MANLSDADQPLNPEQREVFLKLFKLDQLFYSESNVSLSDLNKEAILEAFKKLSDFHPFIRNLRFQEISFQIEFDFTQEIKPLPHFFKMLNETGFAIPLLISSLMNQDHIRLKMESLESMYLQVSAGSDLTKEIIEKFFESLKNKLSLIFSGKLLRLTQHLWNEEFTERALETTSPIVFGTPKAEQQQYRTIAFTSHLVDERHLILLDPLFRRVSREMRSIFLENFGKLAKPCHYHDQIIEGLNGKKIRLCSLGTFRVTRFFEETLRNKDPSGSNVVEEMVKLAKEKGADLVGLGQYTSIVTKSGETVQDLGVGITSGNSLTAGFAFQALVRLMKERSLDWKTIRVGVVGALGNIGAALTEVLLDQGCELTLIVREVGQIETAEKRFSLAKSRIEFSSDLTMLKNCDVVIAAANTVQPILFPEHFKQNAIMIDVSVPSVVSSQIHETRKDIGAYQGGLAKLPLKQTLKTDWMPLPEGQIYACLAETLVLGLSGHEGSYSLGNINKEKVYDILNRAEQVGVTLGNLLPLQARS